MPRLEFGTLQMTVSVKGGELTIDTPRLDILQNNLPEVLPLVPDGTYQWTLTMDVDSAKKLPLPTPE